MTMPGASRGQPMFDQVARETIAAARGRQNRPVPPLPPAPMTGEEKKLAEQMEREQRYCRFCGGAHALPSTSACPRLASFELDGDGQVKSGTFFAGRKWAKGRVVFREELEEDGDDG